MPEPGHKPITPVPAWADHELADPHANRDKAAKVRSMFGAIARAYDLNNRVHSLGRDQAWRRCAVRAAGVRAGDTVLDVACGTGDLTLAFAGTDAAQVVGVDFTPEMLAVAARKLDRSPEAIRAKVSYVEGDALELPAPDASVDVVSIAFGIRNVTDPARAVAEMARVLKPGGRLVILEFDRPSFPPARWLNDLYCGVVMPRSATLISGDQSGAYKYLPKSVARFMSRKELAALIGGSGFREVSVRGLSFGICALYRAVRSR